MNILKIEEKQKQLQEKAAKKSITLTFSVEEDDNYKITFRKHGLSFSMIYKINGFFVGIRTKGEKYIVTVLNGECFPLAVEYLDVVVKERNVCLYDLYDSGLFRSYLTEKKQDVYCTTQDWFADNKEILDLAEKAFPLLDESMHYVMKKEEHGMIERYFLLPGELDDCMHTISSKYPTLVYKKTFDFLNKCYYMDIQHYGKKEIIEITVMPKGYEIKISQKTYTEENLLDFFHRYMKKIETEMRLQNLYTPDVYHLTEALKEHCTEEQISSIHSYLRKQYDNQEIERKAMECKKKGHGLELLDVTTIHTNSERIEAKWYQFFNVYMLKIATIQNGTVKKLQSIIGEETDVIERYEKEVLPMMNKLLSPKRKEVIHEGA